MKVHQFKNIIKESLREVIREELGNYNKEVEIPLKKIPYNSESSYNPLDDILNEIKSNYNNDSFFQEGKQGNKLEKTTEDMFKSANIGQKFEDININEVPNYSKLMNKMT